MSMYSKSYLANYSLYPVMPTGLSIIIYAIWLKQSDMHPSQVKANMAINNTSGKRILFNISIIETTLEFNPLLGHRKC